jgi:hypothetical protein
MGGLLVTATNKHSSNIGDISNLSEDKITLELCEEHINNGGDLKHVPDIHKTPKMCETAVLKNVFAIYDVPKRCMTFLIAKTIFDYRYNYYYDYMITHRTYTVPRLFPADIITALEGLRSSDSIINLPLTNIDLTEDCSICKDSLNNTRSVIKIECNHVFHRECLDEWFSGKVFTCPYCRREVLEGGKNENHNYITMMLDQGWLHYKEDEVSM